MTPQPPRVGGPGHERPLGNDLEVVAEEEADGTRRVDLGVGPETTGIAAGEARGEQSAAAALTAQTRLDPEDHEVPMWAGRLTLPSGVRPKEADHRITASPGKQPSPSLARRSPAGRRRPHGGAEETNRICGDRHRSTSGEPPHQRIEQPCQRGRSPALQEPEKHRICGVGPRQHLRDLFCLCRMCRPECWRRDHDVEPIGVACPQGDGEVMPSCRPGRVTERSPAVRPIAARSSGTVPWRIRPAAKRAMAGEVLIPKPPCPASQ